MNGFADVHVAFGAGEPRHRRLGNPWHAEVDTGALPPDGPWIGTASGGPAAPGPHHAASGAWRVWAVGDVYAYRDEPADPLGRLAADLATDRAAPERFDAHAVVVAWDGAERRIHVLTDRLGTVHAYLGGAPGRRALGTCFAAVAEGSAREPDWVSITGFCAYGFHPADRTPWTDVAVLRPATWTTVDEQGGVVTSRRTWDWWHDPDHGASDDDLLDDFHERWTRAVRTRIAGRPAVVPLSGGLDSRTAYAALPPAPDAGAAVHPLTYGYAADSVEIRLSRAVARARGRRADETVVGPYLFDRLDQVVGAVEGFQALTYSRQAAVSDRLAARGRVVVGGHWGDVWFDTAGAAPAVGEAPGAGPATSIDLVARAHAKFAKRGRAWLLEHVCAPHLGGIEPEAVLRDLLADELARIPDLGDPDLRLKALKTEQWSFRWTLASVRAYQLGVATVLPFYADDVVDLFLRVPTDRLAGRRLQIAYLRRHHADLAGVPWQQTGRPLVDRPWGPAAGLVRRAGAKAWRLARRRPVVERNWEVQYLTGDGPARLRALLAGAGPLLTPDVVGRSGALVDDLVRAPTPATAHAVDTLATLATLATLDPT